MFQFLRQWIWSDYGSPPPPDLNDQPSSFCGQRIVEIRWSESKSERVFITVDEAGNYRVYFQWWDTSDWDAGHGARWSPGEGSGSLTDNLERAWQIADETLTRSPKCDE